MRVEMRLLFVCGMALGVTFYCVENNIILRMLGTVLDGKYKFNLKISCFQRKEYVKYAKVFPLTAIVDMKIPSKWYRRIVGILEVVCGLAMAVIPSRK